MRPVAPGADKVAVIPAARDHHMGDAQRQGTVGAGPHPQPQIGLVGQPGATWIDDDETHAAFQRLDDGGRVCETRDARIVAPEDQAAGIVDVGHRAAAAGADTRDAKGVACRASSAPTTHLGAGDRVRGADRVHQPADIADGIGDRGGGKNRGLAEGDSLRSRLRRRCGALRRLRSGRGLVPGDRLPAGIGGALRVGAAYAGWSDAPGCRPVPAPHGPSPHRSPALSGAARIGIEPDKPKPSSTVCNCAAAGDAQAAITVDPPPGV